MMSDNNTSEIKNAILDTWRNKKDGQKFGYRCLFEYSPDEKYV